MLGAAAPPGAPTRASAAATRTAPLPAAVTRAPSAADSVLADTAPGALSAAFARTLFAAPPSWSCPAPAGPALPAAEAAARAAHAPLLLASPGTARP